MNKGSVYLITDIDKYVNYVNIVIYLKVSISLGVNIFTNNYLTIWIIV